MFFHSRAQISISVIFCRFAHSYFSGIAYAGNFSTGYEYDEYGPHMQGEHTVFRKQA